MCYDSDMQRRSFIGAMFCPFFRRFAQPVPMIRIDDFDRSVYSNHATDALTVDGLKNALAELAKMKGPICLTGELCFVRAPHNPDNPAFRAMANYLHHGTQK